MDAIVAVEVGTDPGAGRQRKDIVPAVGLALPDREPALFLSEKSGSGPQPASLTRAKVAVARETFPCFQRRLRQGTSPSEDGPSGPVSRRGVDAARDEDVAQTFREILDKDGGTAVTDGQKA